MTTNHIDQLAQWWDEAEEGVIEKGDTVINRSESETTVYVATVRAHRQHPNARILARAPKPKPAWHDAVAVIATFRDDCGMVTGVWVQEGKPGYWEGPEGDVVASELLEDVTPLIEARVTNESLRLALNAFYGADYSSLSMYQVEQQEDMYHALHAALGLEAE